MHHVSPRRIISVHVTQLERARVLCVCMVVLLYVYVVVCMLRAAAVKYVRELLEENTSGTTSLHLKQNVARSFFKVARSVLNGSDAFQNVHRTPRK